MNRTSIAPREDDRAAGERKGYNLVTPASVETPKRETHCFHCGEPCAGSAVEEKGKSFCCAGCHAVFALLSQSGLGQYYDLAAAPGTRMRHAGAAERWVFLDDLELQKTLLDFADERRAKVTLRLPSIHCIACVWLLENLFRLRPGIGESRVDFVRRETSITFDRAQMKLSELATLLTSLGYEPELTYGTPDSNMTRRMPPWRQRQWTRLGVAGFGFGNAMLLALPAYLGLDSLSEPWFRSLAGWLGLALAVPVLIYSAADYWRAAWTSLRQRTLTLDVPIALGLAAIFGQSVFEVAAGREGYADSLTGLIFFLLCGRLFQRKTFDRLAFDRNYKGFFPLAVVRRSAGREVTVPISQLAAGDRLVIRHGELVPADAKLVLGEGCLDYSFVTGEAEPVLRQAGEFLYAGGRQNGGAIEVETVKEVSESYLTSLWNSETFRRSREDERESLTNRYSRRFTLFVIGLALAAAAFWWWANPALAFKAFTSVLIVACPCALALAAPLTLGTAQRCLGEAGLYLRNASVVEQLARIDTVVLDKTGTLTARASAPLGWHGAPLTEAERRWIGSMARSSVHPAALGIRDWLGGEIATAPVSAFGEEPGCGMEGVVEGHRVWMGSERWLDSRGVHPAGSLGEGRRAATGSAVHVAIDGRPRGVFLLGNALRPEVDSLIARLRGRHQLVLLSGDHGREADRFQALLGPGARVEFNQSPFRKLSVIREIQAGGSRVMMVGDGLNDAGALRQSDVGVAVVENVGTFSPASDVILEAGRLPQLAEVLEFGRRAVLVVRAGFVVSGLYNVVGVSIAAAGLLSPLVCAVLMPLSSASVVVWAVGATRWAAHRTLGFRRRQGRSLLRPVRGRGLLAAGLAAKGAAS